MSDLAGMSTGTWIVVIVAAMAVLAVGGYFVWKWAWLHISKRYLVTLIGRRESVQAARKSLEDVVRHLAGGSSEDLMGFATDEHSPDRKAFIDVAKRSAVLADELYTMPLPKGLWAVGQALGDAAATISEEAGRVGEGLSADHALVALGEIDLGRVATDSEAADADVDQACAHYDVEEASVYGGGLYIWNLSGRILRGLVAVVLLALVAMFVMSYWGHYRAATTSSGETTETVAPSSEATEGDQGGSATSGQTVEVLTDGVNFRQTPEKDGKKIDGLKKGDKLTYLGTEGDWFKVRASDGAEGYVTSSDQYTKLR